MKIKNIYEKRINFSENSNEKNLVIMFHGYGADAPNILEVSALLNLPNCIFIAPDSPLECTSNPFDDSMMAVGRKWFDIDPNFDHEVLFERVSKIEKDIINFIDEQLKKYNVPHSNLILLGFSQGAMLAIHLGLRMQQKMKAIVALSGFAICPEKLQKVINSKPKIFILYGQNDPIIPFVHFEESVKFFIENKIPHQAKPMSNLLHEIDERVIQESEKFLIDCV